VQKGVPGGLLTGILFQYPGFLIAALVGAGAANVLKHPAPWLHGLTSGARPAPPFLPDSRDRSKLGGLAHGVLALLGLPVQLGASKLAAQSPSDLFTYNRSAMQGWQQWVSRSSRVPRGA